MPSHRSESYPGTMKKEYFKILGLKPGSSDKEIRSAYKKLAKKYHPDVNPGNKQAEEKFKEISEAYEVLSDPEKRSKWESGDLDFESFFRNAGAARGPGASARGAETFSSFRFNDAEDLGAVFENLFGGTAGRGRAGAARRPFPGADLQYQASIGFEEAVRGTTLRIPLARTVACTACHGTGSIRAGKTSVEPCTTCGGTGTRRVSETIQVRIPPGAEDGSRVRVAGKGEGGEGGGPSGDLYVVLQVQPHPYFRREGKDIILDVPLTVSEAALGTRIDVPTIDGRVTLTVPGGSSSGQRLRLKGRGVPSRSNASRGDQIVVLQIVTPRTLNPQSRKVFEELQRLNLDNPREGTGW